MEEILAKAGSQAVTFAIRSGISLASGFAIKRVSKFLDKIPENEKRKITIIKNKIQTKIDILSISIDLIKLASARGNTSLEATSIYIDELTKEFDVFDETLVKITNDLTNLNEKESIMKVNVYMKDLLEKIDEAIPLLNLSLNTCGVNLNGNLPDHISPGRLLQASDFINKSNTEFKQETIQVGPRFDLVLYSIFYNPSRLKYIEKNEQASELSSISWKEEFARCLGRIMRSFDKENEYSYSLEFEEDFNDGRYHEDTKGQVRKYSIKQLRRLFFSASGKLLRLESRSSPVLILKLMDQQDNEEWIALGEVKSGEFDDSDDDDEEEEEDDDAGEFHDSKDFVEEAKNTSLSLLEYLIRLSILQQNDQKSILEVHDERLSLYLRDENSNSIYNPVVLASKKQQIKQLSDNKKTEGLLTMNSNINRLENLKIDK